MPRSPRSAGLHQACRGRLIALGLSLLCGLGVLHPANAADRNLGVANCAGSTCHAATRPFADRAILQDEYYTWQRKDRHAQAYRTLLSTRSQAITARLGWGAPEQSAGCLSCHAHAPIERGARFQLEDGIGCEACHGGAERWIAEHVNGLKTPAAKVAHGMTATWDSATRAQLCSGCHLADPQHPMTHAIMAAGHPPLLFELDTFTALLPPHWNVDADYRQRKPAPDAARNWLEGQIVAVDSYLARLEDGALGHGLFPELALFDCDACHHPIVAARVQPGRTPQAMPGTVPLADQSLVLLQAALEVLVPQQAGRAAAERLQLYQHYRDGSPALQKQAAQMRLWLRMQAIPALRERPLSAAQIREVLRHLVSTAQATQRGDFAYAQQLAMATQVLGAALQDRGAPNPKLRRASDALFDAVRDRDRFAMAPYRQALDALEAAL